MDEFTYGHMALKRSYPFDSEQAHIPQYGQRVHRHEVTPVDEPLCLLGVVTPTFQ